MAQFDRGALREQDPVPMFETSVLGSVPTAPAWTADAFESNVWRAINPNPARAGSELVRFDDIPDTFRVACKEYLWAINQTSELGRRRARSAGTASVAATHLRRLTKFLHGQGVASFAAATAGDIEAAIAAYARPKTGPAPASTTARRYMEVMSSLYDLGPNGSRAIRDGLMFDPAAEAINVGTVERLRAPQPTRELTEDCARELLLLGVDWVERKAEAIVWVARAAREVGEEQARLKKLRGYFYEADMLDYFARSPELLAGVRRARDTLGGPLGQFVPRWSAEAAGRHPRVGSIELDCLRLGPIAMRLQAMLQSLCYVVCAGFNGWRVSELLSVEPASLRETPSGHMLASKVRKTAANPRQTAYFGERDR